jgi:hypothetical protein
VATLRRERRRASELTLRRPESSRRQSSVEALGAEALITAIKVAVSLVSMANPGRAVPRRAGLEVAGQ